MHGEFLKRHPKTSIHHGFSGDRSVGTVCSRASKSTLSEEIHLIHSPRFSVLSFRLRMRNVERAFVEDIKFTEVPHSGVKSV